MNEKSIKQNCINLGVCYYPEHWPETMWPDDFRRMKELGFHTIRVGEFAWSILEPKEGRYDFSLFDRALDLAHSLGLQVILGTPTATPPAWLTHKHPEILNAAQDGTLLHHGHRRHYNYNAPVYWSYCAKITEQLAVRYGQHPAVIGWQIDNELNCEINEFYSEADHTAFREWARRKYATLEALNQAWGTVFWSQTYTEWEQVFLPRTTVQNSPNPHQVLDMKRFVSDSAIQFSRIQADIIRRHAPHHWITTNGIFGGLNWHRLTQEQLDFISYDSYPLFGILYPDEGPEPLKDRRWGLQLSAVRSISPQFCIMEQQTGPGGWVKGITLPTPKPGQMRLWTYQSIAHGADLIMYFRWRTATIGTEIYWHGIHDSDNRPNRRTSEAAQISQELEQVGALLAGKRYYAEIALLHSYDNEWDGDFDEWYGGFEKKSVSAWYQKLQRNHIPMDVLDFNEQIQDFELDRYRVLLYPHPAILSEAAADKLKGYVQRGGVIIFGCRTGYKNQNGHCHMLPLPGYAAALCGVEVEEFTHLIAGGDPVPFIQSRDTEARTFQSSSFIEMIKPIHEAAEVLASYAGEDSGHFLGQAALTRHTFGAGRAYYYGSVFTTEAVQFIIDIEGIRNPLHERLQLSKEIELAVRRDEQTGEQIVLLLNYSSRAQTATLTEPFLDLLGGNSVQGTITLQPYDVCILGIQRS